MATVLIERGLFKYRSVHYPPDRGGHKLPQKYIYANERAEFYIGLSWRTGDCISIEKHSVDFLGM
jgi:hypothetical protein